MEKEKKQFKESVLKYFEIKNKVKTRQLSQKEACVIPQVSAVADWLNSTSLWGGGLLLTGYLFLFGNGEFTLQGIMMLVFETMYLWFCIQDLSDGVLNDKEYWKRAMTRFLLVVCICNSFLANNIPILYSLPKDMWASEFLTKLSNLMVPAMILVFGTKFALTIWLKNWVKK